METKARLKPLQHTEPVTAVVEGGHQLNGDVRLSGSKHSSNLAIAAALLSKSNTVLHEVPALSDTEYLAFVAPQFGFEARMDASSLSLQYKGNVPPGSIRLPGADLHSSAYTIAVISALGGGIIEKFGGCDIGDRFPFGAAWTAERFGVSVERCKENGVKITNCKAIRNPMIDLREVDGSIFSLAQKTAILMASVYGGAIVGLREYQEIHDVLSLISEAHIANLQMDAESGMLLVSPIESRPTEFTIAADPLEYITMLSALLASGGELLFSNRPDLAYIPEELNALKYLGVEIEGKAAKAVRNGPLTGVLEITAPPLYSDALPLIGGAASTLSGAEVKITDKIWPLRKGYALELRKVGCDIDISDNVVVRGGGDVLPGTLRPSNLRDAAGTLVAAMGFRTHTTVSGLENLKRGYDGLIPKLTKVGAEIWVQE